LNVEQTIREKINSQFRPNHLDVINESHMHNVPPGSESHFKVVIVTNAFESKSRVARHQSVNKLLEDELKGSIHALSIETHTPEEWLSKNQQPMSSPKCLGGGKGEI